MVSESDTRLTPDSVLATEGQVFVGEGGRKAWDKVLKAVINSIASSFKSHMGHVFRELLGFRKHSAWS